MTSNQRRFQRQRYFERYFTEDRKEYYRIWREYLKRNHDYKAFCEYIREKREAVKEGKQEPPWTFKWPKRSMEGKQHPAIITFLQWHDIHKYSFEEWWEYRTTGEEGQIISPAPVEDCSEFVSYGGKILWEFPSPAPVEVCSIWLNRLVDHLIGRFIRDQGRDPTAYELRDNLVRHMERGGYGAACLYLQISLAPMYPFPEVEKCFKEIVKPKMMKDSVLRFPEFSTKPRFPKKEELERYLLEYDLRTQGLKIRDIIEKVWPDRQGEYTQRMVYEDLAKAKRIISNTLYNIFPGEYDYTRRKRKAKNTPSVS